MFSSTLVSRDMPRSLALSLPPELWLEILSLLDYRQLKKASRICKTFHEYILVSAFS